MSRSARLVTALVLSAVAVAALTAAGWPRARAVRTLALEGPASVAALTDLPRSDAPTWRLAVETTPDAPAKAYWFAHDDGRLAGPWRPDRAITPRGFDRAGRLVALVESPGDRPPLEVVRYDPATGQLETGLTLPEVRPSEARLSRDLATLAVAIGGDPLRFDVYDAEAGRVRAKLTLPDRRGSVDPNAAAVAALEWAVTHDGRSLVLTEGWDGPKRTTPAGVEVRDAATGGLTRRIAYGGHAHTGWQPQPEFGPQTDVGAVGLGLTSDGRGVCYAVDCRRAGPPASWWGDRRHRLSGPTMIRAELATGELTTGRYEFPDLPGSDDVMVTWWRGTCPIVWVGNAESAAAFSVDESGPGYLTLPPTVQRFTRTWQPKYAVVPGRPEVVFQDADPRSTDEDPLVKWCLGRLGRAPVETPMTRYTHHDGVTGEMRRFRGADGPSPGDGPGEAATFSVGSHDLAVLVNRPGEARATLTLWDLPPRPLPLPWSVPAGVAVGVLLAVGVAALRRTRGDGARR